MSIRRDTIDVDCNFEELFDYMRKLRINGLKVVKVDQKNRFITYTTGIGLFSWGESIEVIVTPHPIGCTLDFRSSPRHPLNLTSDPEGPIRLLIEAVKSKCKS